MPQRMPTAPPAMLQACPLNAPTLHRMLMQLNKAQSRQDSPVKKVEDTAGSDDPLDAPASPKPQNGGSEPQDAEMGGTETDAKLDTEGLEDAVGESHPPVEGTEGLEDAVGED